MTTTAVREPTKASATGHAQGGALAGTGTLIRFMLRRDRIKLPAWLLGMTALLSVFVSAVTELTATEEQRRDLLRVMEGAVGAMLGPGYGRYDITTERYLASVYSFFFFILVALMSILLIARHTRAEEQSGRAELVRSNVVGRHAHLTAALIIAVGANVLLALLLGGMMAANDFDAGQGLLFGAAIAAVGLVFAAITALTVQVTEFSRTATGIAGAVLGAAWAIRAAGDMIEDYGSPLSWFSPLAWSNQTRPYVDGRWWPLLLSLALTAAVIAGAYMLSARRDVGAGLVAARTGAAQAAPWIRTPLTGAFRLQRTGLVWWTVALAAFAMVFGALADQIADPEGMSEGRIDLFGGSLETVTDGYLGMMTMLTAGLAGIMVILGVQAVRTEETDGRAEPVLATAVSRVAWFGSYLTVLVAGLIGLLLVVGLASGIGASIATGDASYLAKMTVAHLVHAPGVLVLLGLAALLLGVLPRAIGVTWAVLGLCLFSGIFGALTDIPQALRNLLPMDHTGHPPLDDPPWVAMVLLLVIAAGLTAAGLAAFQRRDLETK